MLKPAGEVVLRVQDGRYYAGSFDGTDHGVGMDMPGTDLNAWVHLAAVHDGTAWHLYRNGSLAASAPDSVGAVAVAGDWAIGGAADTGDRFFGGAIDEVRLWRVARSADQVASAMNERLGGTEPGLAGLWRADDGVLRDLTAAHHDATLRGAPTAVPGALPAYTVVASVGNQTVETVGSLPSDTWTHVAAVFQQSYGIHVAGTGSYLDAGAALDARHHP